MIETIRRWRAHKRIRVLIAKVEAKSSAQFAVAELEKMLTARPHVIGTEQIQRITNLPDTMEEEVFDSEAAYYHANELSRYQYPTKFEVTDCKRLKQLASIELARRSPVHG